MDVCTAKLTVFFEDPFWVGVLERIEADRLTVCKITFGAEPKDYEVHAFLLENYDRLAFSPSVEAKVKTEAYNPKRMQRELRKQSASAGIGTRSQQALKMQREANRLARKTVSREQKEAEKQRQFELHRQKQREKHRGR